MSEYRRIAEEILITLEDLKHQGGIHVDQLPHVFSNIMGQGEINCYPSLTKIQCCHLSLFLSLNSPSYRKGKGHIDCRKAMEKIVQHMQGACFQKTNVALFVTDNWNATAFEEWRANLEHIRSSCHIEIFLLSGRTVSEINI